MPMNRLMIVLLVLVAALLTVASWRSHAQNKALASDTFRFDARSLMDTASWTKVNVEPYHIPSELDVLCALPTAADYSRARKVNPHVATTITVYVNAVGRSAMSTKDLPSFPQDSVIVKQKNERFTEGKKVLLYTVMR